MTVPLIKQIISKIKSDSELFLYLLLSAVSVQHLSGKSRLVAFPFRVCYKNISNKGWHHFLVNYKIF